MLEILNLEQGSAEWIQARVGLLTASCFSQILAKGRGNSESKTRTTYMYKLAGERITGLPSDNYTNPHMERGTEQEPIARQLYIDRTNNEVVQCGFMKDGNLGYSPDGLIGEDGLLEIKSKLAHLQCDVLLSGEVPSEHVAQIQGGLFVSGRQWLDFVSFCPGMPLFIKRVFRDEKYIEALKKELADFEEELNTVVRQLMAKF